MPSAIRWLVLMIHNETLLIVLYTCSSPVASYIVMLLHERKGITTNHTCAWTKASITCRLVNLLIPKLFSFDRHKQIIILLSFA